MYTRGGGVTIQQDFNGSYGIYLFRKGDYFALSNSFFRLLEYIKTRYPLSLNRDYANYILVNGLASHAYSETPINEISLLPKNAIIMIDIEKRELKFDYIDYKENSIEIDSVEGLQTLDNWFKRQTTIIRNIAEKTNQITVDLSGGFDSRLTFLLVLMSGIDLNKIKINSANDKLHTHAEDYEIATSIANSYGFKLNNDKNWSNQAIPYSLSDIVNISFYAKMTFHKEMYFKYCKYAMKKYRIPGAGGESIRSYWNELAQEHLKKEANAAGVYSKNIADEMSVSITRIISNAYKAIQEKYKIKDDNSIDYPWNLYRETRCRSHFGKADVENFFANVYDLSPLLDPDLWKIKLHSAECLDGNLLIALIFVRYSPKLLTFKFDGGRAIAEETIEYAKKINEKYPLDNNIFNKTLSDNFTISVSDYKVIDTIDNGKNGTPIQGGAPEKYLKKVFDSNSFRNLFRTYFDDEIYRFANSYFLNHNYFSMRHCYSIIGLTKVIEDIMVSNGIANSMTRSLDSFIENDYESTELNIDELKNYITLNIDELKNYITARLDVKISKTENPNLELISTSDNQMKIYKPAWLQNGGLGYTINSCKGYLALVFKTSTSGKLTISLLGSDVRDSNNCRIPYWIHYRNVRYNDESVFDGIKSAWHDKPIRMEADVNAGEIIRLYVEWITIPHKSEKIRLT